MKKSPALLAVSLLLVATLLSGCETVRYVFRPPASDQGRICVTQCAATKEACRGNEIRRANHEKSTCERSEDNKFHACMSRANNKDQQKDCEKHRSSCWSHEDTERCEADYRDCFMMCGGVVEKHVEK